MRQACQHCLNAERSSLAATKCVLTTNLHVLSPRPLRYNGYNNNNNRGLFEANVDFIFEFPTLKNYMHHDDVS